MSNIVNERSNSIIIDHTTNQITGHYNGHCSLIQTLTIISTKALEQETILTRITGERIPLASNLS
jgi:hypothetical protein